MENFARIIDPFAVSFLVDKRSGLCAQSILRPVYSGNVACILLSHSVDISTVNNDSGGHFTIHSRFLFSVKSFTTNEAYFVPYAALVPIFYCINCFE